MIHLLLQHLVWFIVRSLMLTWRYEKVGLENLEKARRAHPQGAFLQAFWHEHLLAYSTAQAWSGPFLGMVSRSKDGDYAAFLLKKMGFTAVRGSSRKRGKDKGGQAAMEHFVTELLKGASGGLTVDGPKGPRHVCKPGIVIIASETGALIVPGTAVGRTYWEFKSWDRFKIPRPFTTVRVIYGEPVAVRPNLSQSELADTCKLIEQKLLGFDDELIPAK